MSMQGSMWQTMYGGTSRTKTKLTYDCVFRRLELSGRTVFDGDVEQLAMSERDVLTSR